MYDLFISYRRDGGHEMARLLYEHLKLKGLNCFFDLEELGSGQFNIKLLRCIEESENFVLILSPNALERCKNTDDWVRMEIEYAIEKNKNIVPVMMQGFSWPEELPESLAKLPYYNGIQLIREYFDASITRLVELLKLDRELTVPTAAQSSVSNVAPLLKRAFIFLEDEDWTNAEKYCEKVLDIDPENAQAYLGKLMAELKVRYKSDLKSYSMPFDKSDNYLKVLRFGDSALSEELKQYNVIIRERNEENRKLGIYNTGLSLANQQTPEKQLEAAEVFERIHGYRDADSRAKECRHQILVLKYEQAIKATANATTSQQYAEAAQMFLAISSYASAKEKAAMCIAKSKELAEIERKNVIYAEALDAMKKYDIWSIEIAIKKFQTITTWKDSEVKITECNKKIAEIKEQQKQKRIAEEKAKKKKKRTLIITLTSVLLTIILVIIMVPTIAYLTGNYKVPIGMLDLKSFTVPDNVTSIGSRAFSYCSSLTSITIPDSVTSIGERAFSDCSSLTSITIPDSVTSIGSYAFSGCSSLTSITIPDSVTSIGDAAFSGCSSLTSITIPDSVTSIAYYAFDGCINIENATIPTTAIPSIPKNNLKTVVITSGTSIDNSAFSDCSSLTSITIPDSVTSIAYYAFDGCINIENATIPTTAIPSIPKNNLKTVVITSGTSIGEDAFSRCRSLTSITIPDSVTSIGEDAFYGCINIENATIPTTAIPSIPKYNLKTVVITSGTSIGYRAFYDCSSLTSITIPDSVTSIGSFAFSLCSSLKSITIPDSVTSIGDSAFYDCSSLKSITIPDSVTSIGNYAFEDCSSLTSITIPDSVTSIGERAFYGCSSLTNINYSGTKGKWATIEKGYSWDYGTGDYVVKCTDGNIHK